MSTYEGFRTSRLERELRMVQLTATRSTFIAILWASPVSFGAIILCVASRRVSIVVYFVIDSVRELLDIPSYISIVPRCGAQLSIWKRHQVRDTRNTELLSMWLLPQYQQTQTWPWKWSPAREAGCWAEVLAAGACLPGRQFAADRCRHTSLVATSTAFKINVKCL
jgi:hypothetical protein